MVERKRKFTKAVIGDVVEIPIGKKVAYAQYTHQHETPPHFGALIRVLPGIFSKRPASFSALVRKKERFYTFFPVGAAVRQGLVKIVAHENIPLRCQSFPVFKAQNINFHTGKSTWFIWDGKTTHRVDKLSAKEIHYPVKEIIGFPVLVEYIKSGWTPADEIHREWQIIPRPPDRLHQFEED